MNVPKTITEMSLNFPKKSVELHQKFTETSLKLILEINSNLERITPLCKGVLITGG